LSSRSFAIPKVKQFRCSTGRNQDISRLQIPVDD
jgi:hypothetical protein